VLVLPVAIGAPLALRAWAGFFFGTAAALIGVGMLIEAQDWRRTLLLGSVVALPVLVSMMVGRHMGAARE
jgi:ascorbate-specific PTS system EIIC-type component UlaA